MKDAYLVLENGRVFKGKAFGAHREVTAEVVFTTGMTGYLETLTDPSYYGQAVVQTFPLIGNYGIIPADFESPKINLTAYIVKEWCRNPSNFRSEGDLDTFLKARDIPGLCGIDTRSLTKCIRESGIMNGALTSDPACVDRDALKAYRIQRAVEQVSAKAPYTEKAANARRHVAVLDYGMKTNIKRELLARDCDVTVMPYDTPPDAVLATRPHGIMLSNGPGDPADNPAAIENLKGLLRSEVPIFGICLGHQLLALASGGKTTKLKYGHRGANQPVRDLETGRVYITSQNHGYAVVSDSVARFGKLLFVNVNDGSCEGIAYSNRLAFSVQFHPEHCSGPQDSAFLFDRFVDMMEEKACR